MRQLFLLPDNERQYYFSARRDVGYLYSQRIGYS